MGGLVLFGILACVFLFGAGLMAWADKHGQGGPVEPGDGDPEFDADFEHWRAATGCGYIPEGISLDDFNRIVEAHKAGRIEDAG